MAMGRVLAMMVMYWSWVSCVGGAGQSAVVCTKPPVPGGHDDDDGAHTLIVLAVLVHQPHGGAARIATKRTQG